MKHRIRKEILSLRENHPKEHSIEKSEKIKENLFSMPEFKNSKTILFYVSTKNEVRTGEMIKESLNSGKKIAVPISDVENKTIKISEIRDFDQDLESGSFGILEPKRGLIRSVDSKEIDLVIVPGIAFDREGNRIGYGFGYYDNFLKTVSKGCVIIALAYEFQIVEKIPAHQGDVRVQKIVTENGVFGCFNA